MNFIATKDYYATVMQLRTDVMNAMLRAMSDTPAGRDMRWDVVSKLFHEVSAALDKAMQDD